eukprot:2210160-Rhodomonas_salina.2
MPICFLDVCPNVVALSSGDAADDVLELESQLEQQLSNLVSEREAEIKELEIIAMLEEVRAQNDNMIIMVGGSGIAQTTSWHRSDVTSTPAGPAAVHHSTWTRIYVSFKSKLDSDVLTPGSWCDAMQIEQSRKELEHAAELQVGAQIRLQARQEEIEAEKAAKAAAAEGKAGHAAGGKGVGSTGTSPLSKEGAASPLSKKRVDAGKVFHFPTFRGIIFGSRTGTRALRGGCAPQLNLRWKCHAALP